MLSTRIYFYEEEVTFVLSLFTSIKQRVCVRLHALQERVLRWIKPQTTSFVLGTFADLTRGKAELLAENAVLATCGICPSNVAFENTFLCFSRLADSPDVG
jgi:hypothetical protein